MQQGPAAASASSAAPASSSASGVPASSTAAVAAEDDEDDEFGKHAPGRLVKRLKKVSQTRELTAQEQGALAVAKTLWNRERRDRRQRKKGVS